MDHAPMLSKTYCSLGAVLALAVSMAAPATAAGDDALYDQIPPEDAVFIRSFAADAPAQVLGPLPAAVVAQIAEGAEVYSSLSAGEFAFPEPGRYYAIVADGAGTLHLVPEPERADRSKVRVILVNASGQEVRVTAPDHGMEVVAATPPLGAASRAVNPIDVVLAVENPASGAVLGTMDLSLRRGQNVTILVHADRVEVVEEAFGPVIAKD
jgi:hypothetical protein